MGFGIDIACAVEIDGQQEVVDVRVSQEYGDSSSVIEATFDWNHFTAGFPLILASDAYSLPSIVSPVNFIAANITRSVNNGVSNPTRITANAAALDIYHSGSPSATQPVDIHFYLANFPKFTRNSPLQVNLNGLLIDFLYERDGRINRKAIISGIALDRLTEAIELLNDCCWLCSLAAGCLVTVPRVEVLMNGSLLQTKLMTVDLTMPDIGKPLVHERMSPIALKDFLEGSLTSFRHQRNNYSLCLLIHLGLLAKHHQYLQARALLMSDFLEVLRDRFALSICVPKGFMTRKGAEFYWKVAPRGCVSYDLWKRLVCLLPGKNLRRKRATFQEILKQFCLEQRLTGWDNDFKKFRNEIMHTGDIRGPNKMARYRKLHHFCDRALLALLNWDSYGGHYIPFDNQVATSSSHNSSNVSVNRIPYSR